MLPVPSGADGRREQALVSGKPGKPWLGSPVGQCHRKTAALDCAPPHEFRQLVF